MPAADQARAGDTNPQSCGHAVLPCMAPPKINSPKTNSPISGSFNPVRKCCWSIARRLDTGFGLSMSNRRAAQSRSDDERYRFRDLTQLLVYSANLT
jgi:hypothetical protein